MTEDTTLGDFASSGSDDDGGVGADPHDPTESDDLDDRANSADALEGEAADDGDVTDERSDCDVEPDESSNPPSDVQSDPASDVPTDPAVQESESVATPATTFACGDYECGTCGREAERVWRDDGEYVCPSCKQW